MILTKKYRREYDVIRIRTTTLEIIESLLIEANCANDSDIVNLYFKTSRKGVLIFDKWTQTWITVSFLEKQNTRPLDNHPIHDLICVCSVTAFVILRLDGND